jgi:NAD(P)-dependent dehydrogenase (short-subunit alcohol dehydrogenase family)
MNQTSSKPAVFITGTSSGIGRVTALELDRLGYRVLASVRRQEDAQALQAEASPSLLPIMLELTEAQSIAQAKTRVSKIVGQAGLAGLVNNAGYGFTSPLEFVPLDELRHLFEVHVFGALALIQAMLPLLRRAKGRIVNMSSTATLNVAPFHGPYSCAKLSLNGISAALRRELRPQGIEVSNIICGSIRTPIWERGSQQSDAVMNAQPAAAQELYGQNWEILGRFFQDLGANGQPPELAAKAILHALTARRPKANYYVGPDARLYKIAGMLLPDRLYDWLTLRTIGIS